MNVSVARNARPRPASRSARRSAPNAARCSGRCVVEPCESRILFHMDVQSAIPDQVVSIGTPSTTISLTNRMFNEIGPTVRFNYGTLGNIDIQLLQQEAPKSVANFLTYVNAGTFNNTVIHRSEPGFIIQGGGFRPDGSDITGPGTPTVPNEFSAQRSNIRGTVAYAKLGNDPNSATSEFFYNLANNASNLDNQNGGFTVFGRVLGNGMTVADAIGGLPRVNASPINSAMNHLPVTRLTNPTLTPLDPQTDLPTQTPSQDQMVITQSATVSSVSYSAVSSNTSLVGANVVGGNSLILNYLPNKTGTATITLTGTESITGATATDTFTVTIGATEVGMGQGAQAQSVRFTDSDGTVSTLSVHGGSATVRFNGTNITQALSGRTTVISGTNVSVGQVVLAGPNPNATVETVGGDGKVDIGGITAAGWVRRFSGRGVVLKGSSTFDTAVGQLNVAAAADGATISAPFVRNLRVSGDLAADITAGSINALTAGSITGSNIVLTLAPAAKAVGLNSLSSSGAITNSLIRSAANIGTVTAGAISGSSIYAGVSATTGGFLPTAVGDFASASSIRGVTVRNRGTTPGFANSDVAASALGRMNLGLVQVDNAGVPFGLAADTIQSLSAVGAGGAPLRTGVLTDAGQSIDQTDFEVRVL
jgi:cyclophilin family peptidyl-prolyl cis-trans isomerase